MNLWTLLFISFSFCARQSLTPTCKFRIFENNFSFSILYPDSGALFAEAVGDKVLTLFDQLLEDLSNCVRSFDETSGVSFKEEDFKKFSDRLIGNKFLKRLVGAYIGDCTDSDKIEIKEFHNEWDTHLSDQQGHENWTREKFIFLHGLISRLYDCWTKPPPKVLVMIRMALLHITRPVVATETYNKLTSFFLLFEKVPTSTRFPVKFLGKLCRLLDENNGEIEPFEEILTDSYKYVRDHDPSEGVAKWAYVQKLSAIREILFSLMSEGYVKQIEISGVGTKSDSGATSPDSNSSGTKITTSVAKESLKVPKYKFKSLENINCKVVIDFKPTAVTMKIVMVSLMILLMICVIA